MKIYFSSDQMAKIFNHEANLQKKYGHLAKKIQQRMFELKAGNTLSEISHLPPSRRHKLGNNRKDQWAVDLNRNYRLAFKPCNDPIVLLDDGSVDLTRVTEILIVGVVDYH